MNKRVQSPLGPGQGLGCGPPGQGGTVIRERPLLRVVDREGGDNYLGKFYGRIVRSQLPLILTNTLQSEQEKRRDLTLYVCMYVCMYSMTQCTLPNSTPRLHVRKVSEGECSSACYMNACDMNACDMLSRSLGPFAPSLQLQISFRSVLRLCRRRLAKV